MHVHACTHMHTHIAHACMSIQGQATEEQKEKWLQIANNYEIIGTYAQTELGHGEFIFVRTHVHVHIGHVHVHVCTYTCMYNVLPVCRDFCSRAGDHCYL